MEHTHFRISELSVGWMSWAIRGPGIKEDIYASWAGDPTLDPMLRLATSMLTFRKEHYFWHSDAMEWDDFKVTFVGEPECYRATFCKPEGDTVGFVLEKCDHGTETSSAPYREIGRGTVNMAEFVDDLLADAVGLLREYGFVGFYEMWQRHEYPVAELLRLIAVRRGGEPFRRGLAQELKDLLEILADDHFSEARPESPPDASS